MIDEKKLLKELDEDCNKLSKLYSGTHNPDYLMQLEGMEKAIKRIESQPPADNWIPVTERLPEKSDFYDVTFELDGGLRICQREYFDAEDNIWFTPYNVIAWKERPEPYEGE